MAANVFVLRFKEKKACATYSFSTHITALFMRLYPATKLTSCEILTPRYDFLFDDVPFFRIFAHATMPYSPSFHKPRALEC